MKSAHWPFNPPPRIGFGEVAHASRVDNGDVVAGIEEVGHEQAFVAAGGLEDDAAGRRGGEQLAELPFLANSA